MKEILYICDGCVAHSYWESDGHYCHRFGKKCGSVKECKKKNRKRKKT